MQSFKRYHSTASVTAFCPAFHGQEGAWMDTIPAEKGIHAD